MTEDEMKKTWCPHVRVSADGTDGPINRWTVDHDDARNPFGDHNACIGSACSQWRWQWVPDATRGMVLSKVEGFCGLAGNP